MKDLEALFQYFKDLIYQVPGLERFHYVDSGLVFDQQIQNFFGNINLGGRPCLLLSVFEAPLIQHQASDYVGGYAIQLFVLQKADASNIDAIMANRNETDQLLKQVIGKMQVDVEEQPTGPGRWYFSIDQNRLLPEANIANAGVYGWSVDIDIQLEVNPIMFKNYIE